MALIWNEKDKVFDVVPGTCPSPSPDDDGSAKQCVQRGNCGCDEATKPENQEVKMEKLTTTQRELLELVATSPRGYVTKTEEGGKDMCALAMMRFVHDVYEMAGGGFSGHITQAGRAALAQQ